MTLPPASQLMVAGTFRVEAFGFAPATVDWSESRQDVLLVPR